MHSSLPIPDAAAAAVPRVLIVDDSAVARAVLSRFVTSEDRFALAAAVPDARRALEFLSRERVDVILLDLEMPHTHGIDALPQLIAAGQGARVLVVSSAAADGAQPPWLKRANVLVRGLRSETGATLNENTGEVVGYDAVTERYHVKVAAVTFACKAVD